MSVRFQYLFLPSIHFMHVFGMFYYLFVQAIADLTKALEFEPNSADILHERGKLYTFIYLIGLQTTFILVHLELASVLGHESMIIICFIENSWFFLVIISSSFSGFSSQILIQEASGSVHLEFESEDCKILPFHNEFKQLLPVYTLVIKCVIKESITLAELSNVIL